jgi:hypothetical protein
VAAISRSLAAGLAVLSLLGCASGGRTEKVVLAGTAARSLLILPLNVAVVMPSELETLSPVVWEELETYLRAQDKELKTVSHRAARSLWLVSIKRARAEKGAEAGYDDAARLLVQRLAQHAEFDTVIAPSLYVREARIKGRIASWDGVSRKLEIEARGVAARTLIESPLEGLAPAASLHAVVLDAQGNKLQEALGGVDLLVGVRVLRDPAAPSGTATLEFVPRTDLASNREHVREAIAEALSPFLAPEGR